VKVDQAVDFFNAYLDVEFAEAVAVYHEPDDVLASRREVSESYMYSLPGFRMASRLGRPPMSAERLAELSRSAKVSRRVLFMVNEYRHVNFGPIFAAFVSGAQPILADSYESLLYATEVDEEIKIISEFFVDFDHLSSVKWNHAQGVDVGDPGESVAVRALTEPGEPEHQRDWLRMRDATA
jgi:hypothetical protein